MMYAAIIAVCLVVLALVAAFAKLALMIQGAEQRASDWRAGDTTKAGQLAIAAAEIATHKNVAETEKRRADALDDELANVANDGDVAGARDRVLARWRRQADPDTVSTTGDGPSPVPAPAPTGTPADRDALILPE